MYETDSVNKKPEDSKYTVDVLTRCSVRRDAVGKKIIDIISLKEPGEPVVVSVPLSQASGLLLLCYLSQVDLTPENDL